MRIGARQVALDRAERTLGLEELRWFVAELKRSIPSGVSRPLPVVGCDWAPGEEDPDTGDPLRADFSDAMVARFDRAAAELAAAGWRVVRIPEVPFLDKTYMAYTNGVYETPPWRVPGTFYVTCSVHPEMTLKVVVTP